MDSSFFMSHMVYFCNERILKIETMGSIQISYSSDTMSLTSDGKKLFVTLDVLRHALINFEVMLEVA